MKAACVPGMLQSAFLLALLPSLALARITCSLTGVRGPGNSVIPVIETGASNGASSATVISQSYDTFLAYFLLSDPNDDMVPAPDVTYSGEGTQRGSINAIGLLGDPYFAAAEVRANNPRPGSTNTFAEQRLSTFTFSYAGFGSCIVTITFTPPCSVLALSSSNEGALGGNQNQGYFYSFGQQTSSTALGIVLVGGNINMHSVSFSPFNKGLALSGSGGLMPTAVAGVSSAFGQVTVSPPAGSTPTTLTYTITWSAAGQPLCSSVITVRRPTTCLFGPNYCEACSSTNGVVECTTCKRGITSVVAFDSPADPPTSCPGWASLASLFPECVMAATTCANSPTAVGCGNLGSVCPPCPNTGCTASYSNLVSRGWTGVNQFTECRVVCLPLASASIDPHFVGMDGSRFDFHGVPDKCFNLISQEHHQISAYFFLANASIFHGPENGTFMGEIGVKYLQDEVTINAQETGTILVSVRGLGHLFAPLWSSTRVERDSGMTVTLQDKSLGVDELAEAGSVQYVDITTPDISLRVYSPDDARARPYLNLEIQKVSSELLHSDMHGVIGQTAGWLVKGEGMKHYFPWEKEAAKTRKERTGSKPHAPARDEEEQDGRVDTHAAISVEAHTHQPFVLEGTTEDYIMPHLFSTNSTFNKFRNLSADESAAFVSHQRQLRAIAGVGSKLVASPAGHF